MFQIYRQHLDDNEIVFKKITMKNRIKTIHIKVTSGLLVTAIYAVCFLVTAFGNPNLTMTQVFLKMINLIIG